MSTDQCSLIPRFSSIDTAKNTAILSKCPKMIGNYKNFFNIEMIALFTEEDNIIKPLVKALEEKRELQTSNDDRFFSAVL